VENECKILPKCTWKKPTIRTNTTGELTALAQVTAVGRFSHLIGRSSHRFVTRLCYVCHTCPSRPHASRVTPEVSPVPVCARYQSKYCLNNAGCAIVRRGPGEPRLRHQNCLMDLGPGRNLTSQRAGRIKGASLSHIVDTEAGLAVNCVAISSEGMQDWCSSATRCQRNLCYRSL
jgi:hypothetical protein